jgi:hypothetical protein
MMNAILRDIKNWSDADGEISHGEITAAALEEVSSAGQRARERELQSLALLVAAGVCQPAVVRSEKEVEREKLLQFARKTLEPERLIQQLCAGVASRHIKANTALWLAQGVANAACNLAAREWVRRSKESGLTRGFDMTKDDQGVWAGFEATDTPSNARDNRATANVFSPCDEPEVVEGTYQDWYASIEVPLLALAGASADRSGGCLLAGQHSRWAESPGGLTQIIEDFADRAKFYLDLSNDSNVNPGSPIESPWAKF